MAFRASTYGSPFAAGNWRRGLSETATMELHGEAGAQVQVAGAGLTWVWAPLGEFGLHGAASRSQDAGNGTLGRVSFAHIAPGVELLGKPAIRQRRLHAGCMAGQPDAHDRADPTVPGALPWPPLWQPGPGLHGIALQRRRRGQGAFAQPFHSTRCRVPEHLCGAHRLGRHGESPARRIGRLEPDPSAGRPATASATTNRQNGKTTTTVDVSQATPSDEGLGWRVAASNGETKRAQAEATWRTPYASFNAQVVDLNKETSARVLAEGSLGYTSGMFFAAQSSSDGFALVTVPGAAGIKIYRENNLATTTDGEGMPS